MDKFSHKVIIISRNLDGFSLVNHRRRICQIRQTSPPPNSPAIPVVYTERLAIYMLNKNTLGVKKVRGQSEAALQTGATKNFDIS